MNSVFGFVVGLLQAALSLLGFVQQHPELPQSSRDQAQQVAQQAITQATQALAQTSPNSQAQFQNTVPTNVQSSNFNFTYKGEYNPLNDPIYKDLGGSFNPDLATKYSPIWKKAFEKKNGVSDEYVNSHTRITATEIRNGRFIVHYYFSVDWAKVGLTDSFIYKAGDTEVGEGCL